MVTTGASLWNNLPEDARGDVEKALGYLYSLDDPLNNMKFGAEINSTVSLLNKKDVPNFDSIYLLVSDTEIGKFIGEVLKRFWRNNPFGYVFSHSDVRVIEKLNDKNPGEFRAKGLRNLVKTMAEIYRASKGKAVVNATGGYKAQIALATALGQALGMKVYYRFERFDYIIELVPIPLEISTDIVKAYLEAFMMLDCSKDGLTKREFREYFEWENFAKVPDELKVFIDEVEGRYFLSPMGQVYLESTRIDYEDIENLRFFQVKGSLKLAKDEPHIEQIFKTYSSLINKIVSLKPVSRVVVKGGGNIYTAEKSEVKAENGKVSLILSGSKGNIHVNILTKCESSRKFHEILANKIEELLKEI